MRMVGVVLWAIGSAEAARREGTEIGHCSMPIYMSDGVVITKRRQAPFSARTEHTMVVSASWHVRMP